MLIDIARNPQFFLDAGDHNIEEATNELRTLHGEETTTMNRIKNMILKIQVLKDTKGQDLIEYALMAGFVAVAAGAIMPGVSQNISQIFSKIASSMGSAASQGS